MHSKIPFLRNLSAGVRHHALLLTACCGVIVAAFLLRVVDDQRVALRVWPYSILPQSCFSRSLLQVDCPGCGLTRSFVYLAAGQVRQSLRAHPVGWFLMCCFAAQIPWRILVLWRKLPDRTSRWNNWLIGIALAGMLINWISKALLS